MHFIRNQNTNKCVTRIGKNSSFYFTLFWRTIPSSFCSFKQCKKWCKMEWFILHCLNNYKGIILFNFVQFRSIYKSEEKTKGKIISSFLSIFFHFFRNLRVKAKKFWKVQVSATFSPESERNVVSPRQSDLVK